MRISWLTTHAEMEAASPEDREKLSTGLEVRTICCYQFVRTECLLAQCEHGQHEVQDPIGGETSTRCNYPCVLYAPDNARTYHPVCQERRSCSQAFDNAFHHGSIRAEEESEYLED